MDSILGLIQSIITIIFSSFKDINEEDIEKNINFLKQENWFQIYLDDIKYTS